MNEDKKDVVKNSGLPYNEVKIIADYYHAKANRFEKAVKCINSMTYGTPTGFFNAKSKMEDIRDIIITLLGQEEQYYNRFIQVLKIEGGSK